MKIKVSLNNKDVVKGALLRQKQKPTTGHHHPDPWGTVQRVADKPRLLQPQDALALQQLKGNRIMTKLLAASDQSRLSPADSITLTTVQLAEEEDIKKRAYFIWINEGRPEGKDKEHYFRAKSELESEEQSAVTGPATAAQPAQVPGAHGTVPVPAGPTSAAEVRNLVAASSPSSSDAPTFLAARVRELQGLGIASEVKDQSELIPVLAADMQRKDLMKPVGERQNLSASGWLEAAKGQIEANKTTALTTSDDRYTAIKGGVKFDELHEFIHICSAPGGESPLMQFKLQMNEGAINYFSELTASLVGIPVVERYPSETALVRKLVALVGSDGPAKLYAATFKGDVDGFFRAVGQAYAALGAKKPDGKAKSFSEKGWDATAAAGEFKKQVGNWGLKWLNERLPAA
jgi:hypothetical protein